ncbi:MAG TPA: type II toxin-antitoxin system PemK/MazF family toxin [Egibacteraceae bacterium]|nr:type II toxin-antitoxin system PemK/MazF family toxin [Actinomycetota bacterium]HWB70582.1 type II toxin-antitoxin system PemK/MazF family toxin [Egibacteraceae bacterium]
MLTSGDVVQLDLGFPTGSEAGLIRPAAVITAQRVLAQGPRVIQVVPLTRRMRGYASEVTVIAGADNGLDADSAAQCQHIRAVATERVTETLGNVGAVTLSQIRETLAVLLDL